MPLNNDPFAPAPTPEPPVPQIVAQRLINDYFAAARFKRTTYDKFVTTIWGGGEERGRAILAAVEKLKPGLAADMQVSAILEKSVINYVSKDHKIDDTVPVATITMPQ
jgi:hypothetical protein